MYVPGSAIRATGETVSPEIRWRYIDSESLLDRKILPSRVTRLRRKI